MPTGGIKIVSEANLGQLGVGEEVSNGAITITKTRTELEKMFVEDAGEDVYKSGFVPPHTVSSGGRTYVNLDSKCWQGGVTTVVTPSSVMPMFTGGEMSQGGQERRVNRGGGRKPMKMEEEELSPEEEERRRVRRERNKMAAARCRKRRMDQTSTLQEEVDQWEDKKRALQEEIQALRNQKEELHFILSAHKNVCRRSRGLAQPKVVVKAEPDLNYNNSHNMMEEVHSTTTATTSTQGRMDRPATLNIKSNMMRSIEGVNIDTPTSVITCLNFESLMEGRTGLTPTNILTPVSISLTGQPQLNTPSMQVPSCSTQQRNSSGPDMASPDTGSHKLVSL